jgi:hypothetical protein
MRARQIICDGGFGPEDFAVLDAAFEAAWSEIKARISAADGVDRNAARERLATIIVALGKARVDDVGILSAQALEVFDRWQ